MDEKRKEEEILEPTADEIDELVKAVYVEAPTSPAASASRRYISNMISLATFPWMN